MQTDKEDGQVSLFGQDGCAGKMCPALSAPESQREKISVSSSRRLSELSAIPFMSLDLTPGHGNLLGESYWEMISPWLGGSSTLNTGPAPLSAEDVYSLSQILQDNPPRKYYLSRTACLGILRRARERGKELPPQLKAALTAQAGLSPPPAPPDEPAAFAANQRNEVRDLHNIAGALSAQPGMKQQTFIAQGCLTPWDTQQARIFTPDSKAPTLAGADGGGGRNPAGLLFAAGFCAGAGPAAGSVGYQEEVAPTLKAAPSGNMMPSVLCLNDQGGGVMECSRDISGTLRAQEHGHQPLVFDNHGQDSRFRGPVGIAQTVSASFGEGGNNQPLVIGPRGEESSPMVELFENHGIDARYTGPHSVSPTITARAGTGGCNLPLALQTETGRVFGGGMEYQTDIVDTLTAADQHAVYSRQRSDKFVDTAVASTESARQRKDATDLICQTAYQKTVGALTSSDRKGPNNQYVGQDKLVVEGPLLIRRLTPLECERLQGFPDFWTDLPGASDSARYRALGNSVAIPCVEYIMRGIAMAAAS